MQRGAVTTLLPIRCTAIQRTSQNQVTTSDANNWTTMCSLVLVSHVSNDHLSLSADDPTFPFAYFVYELKGAQCSYIETLVVGMLHPSDWIRIQSGLGVTCASENRIWQSHVRCPKLFDARSSGNDTTSRSTPGKQKT